MARPKAGHGDHYAKRACGPQGSVDGGPWQEANLKDPISPLTWRLWRLDWKAAQGRHELRVRATDGQSAAQIEAVAPLHPDGASGYHSKSVDIG